MLVPFVLNAQDEASRSVAGGGIYRIGHYLTVNLYSPWER